MGRCTFISELLKQLRADATCNSDSFSGLVLRGSCRAADSEEPRATRTVHSA
jgi:hypothetical protein